MERVQKPQTPIHQPQEGDLCGQDRHITAVPFALASALSCGGGREGGKALGVGRSA